MCDWFLYFFCNGYCEFHVILTSVKITCLILLLIFFILLGMDFSFFLVFSMHCLIIIFENSSYYRTFGECMYIGRVLIIAYFTYVHKRKSFCVCMIFLLQFLHVFGEGYSWCWSYSVLIILTTLFLFWAHFTQSNQSLVFPSLIFEYLEYVEAWNSTERTHCKYSSIFLFN